MRGSAVGLLALVLSGCSILNASDACDVEPRELQVNEHGDDIEHVGHPQATALMADGKLAVAYVSTAVDESASSVYLVLVEPGTGAKLVDCDGDRQETQVSNPAETAYGATAAAVDLPTPGTRRAAVAVGWSIADEGRGIRIRLFDIAGCPLGDPFSPVPADVYREAMGISLAWSTVRGELLVTFHDRHDVWAAWIADSGPASGAEQIGDEELVFQQPVSALAPDGRGIVAWGFMDAEDLALDGVGVRAVLVDEDARPRPALLAGDEATAFTVAETFMPGGNLVYSVALAASVERYAIVLDSAETDGAPGRLLLRELDARDGAPLRSEDSPDGEAARVDASDDEYQGAGSVLYLPDGALLVLWESLSRDGTTGRLLGPDGRWRFTGVGCDEDPVDIGTRGGQLPGPSSARVVGEDLWVFHAGDPPADTRATAVLGWSVPLDDLWPAR